MELGDQVKDNIRKLSDEALVRIVDVDFGDYSDEAVAFAREELARRGVRSAERGAPAADVKVAAVAETAKPGPGTTKGSRIWGGVFLVVGALIAYTAIMGAATIAVAKRHLMQPAAGAYPRLAIYAVLVGLCLWNGARRTRRWERFLAITSLIFGVLGLVSRINIMRVRPSAEIFSKASTIAGVVMLGLGAAFFLLDLARRRTAERSEPGAAR